MASRALGILFVLLLAGCGSRRGGAPASRPTAAQTTTVQTSTVQTVTAAPDAGAPVDLAGTPRFACGASSCARGRELCYSVASGPATRDGRPSASCQPLPEPCRAAPTCDCLRANPGRLYVMMCDVTSAGDLEVTVAMP